MLVYEFIDCILDCKLLKTSVACSDCCDDVDFVKKIMYDKCHPDHCADLSLVLIHHACDGSSKVVKLLLDDNREHRALPDEEDSYALRLAANYGHSEVVKLLLDDNREHRALPDARGGYALIWAAIYGHSEVVKLLLNDNREHRANANDREALRIAKQHGHTAVVKLLRGNRGDRP